MQTWTWILVAAAAALLAVPLAWVVLRSRKSTYDIEPVSRQWLEDQKRMSGEA